MYRPQLAKWNGGLHRQARSVATESKEPVSSAPAASVDLPESAEVVIIGELVHIISRRD